MDERVSWDEYFMNIARVVATRATCDRKHVGAVIVRDKTILSTGYNGSIRGLPHCGEAGHMMEDGHCVATVHAEANAIIQAAKNGVAIDGATIYTTASPCWSCFKLVAQRGLPPDRVRRVLPGRPDLRVRAAARDRAGGAEGAVPSGRAARGHGLAAQGDVRSKSKSSLRVRVAWLARGRHLLRPEHPEQVLAEQGRHGGAPGHEERLPLSQPDPAGDLVRWERVG